jgi:hypothetical protein
LRAFHAAPLIGRARSSEEEIKIPEPAVGGCATGVGAAVAGGAVGTGVGLGPVEAMGALDGSADAAGVGESSVPPPSEPSMRTIAPAGTKYPAHLPSTMWKYERPLMVAFASAVAHE